CARDKLRYGLDSW
nr:immunoglobulin heavy chain junction region [Macaca mulatta]MOW83359.1 immunoglobulin heavy chain junction region [Macaca mulatta]